MRKIPLSCITEIALDRINCRDEQGHPVSVVLPLCAERYERAHPPTHPGGATPRCVGERCFGEYAYYEFCAEEPIQFYLNLKTSRMQKIITRLTGWNFHAKEFEQFYSVQKRLNAAGWTTLDLT